MARLNESRIGALLTESFGAAFLRIGAATPHEEHGVGVLVGIDADVEVIAGTRAVRGRAVIVSPDTCHAARCPSPMLSIAFDPELNPALAGFARTRGAASVVEDPVIAGAVHAHRASLARAGTLAGIAGEITGRLAGPRAPADRRIARLLDELRDPAADRRAATARTRLSAAHLAALFARDVGIPMRTYALWRRLLHGLAFVGPLDLTAAAHAAGFADLAHLSRTCRRMLGYSPSALRANLADG